MVEVAPVAIRLVFQGNDDGIFSGAARGGLAT